MFAKNSNLSKKPFDNKESFYLHPHLHISCIICIIQKKKTHNKTSQCSLPPGSSASAWKVARAPRIDQPTRVHHTRQYRRRNRLAMEEENAQLRTELASMREELAKALDAMTALVAAQEQPTSSAPETTEAIPTSSLDSRFAMPRGYPYGDRKSVV